MVAGWCGGTWGGGKWGGDGGALRGMGGERGVRHLVGGGAPRTAEASGAGVLGGGLREGGGARGLGVTILSPKNPKWFHPSSK